MGGLDLEQYREALYAFEPIQPKIVAGDFQSVKKDIERQIIQWNPEQIANQLGIQLTAADQNSEDGKPFTDNIRHKIGLKILDNLLSFAVQEFCSCYEGNGPDLVAAELASLVANNKKGRLSQIIVFLLFCYKIVGGESVKHNIHGVGFVRDLLGKFCCEIARLGCVEIGQDAELDKIKKLIKSTSDSVIIESVKYRCIEGIKFQGSVEPGFMYDIPFLRSVLDERVRRLGSPPEFRSKLVTALYEVSRSQDTPETMTIDSFLANTVSENESGRTLLHDAVFMDNHLKDRAYLRALIRVGSRVEVSWLRHCIEFYSGPALPVLLEYVFRSLEFNQKVFQVLKNGCTLLLSRLDTVDMWPGNGEVQTAVQSAVRALVDCLTLNQMQQVIEYCKVIRERYRFVFGGIQLMPEHLVETKFPMLIACLLLGEGGVINRFETNASKLFTKSYEEKNKEKAGFLAVFGDVELEDMGDRNCFQSAGPGQ